MSKGKTVIALLHNDIQNLPKKNFDTDPSLEVKVHDFRDKVKNGRMVRFWNNRDQLALAIMQAIVKAIATCPANGWIRGDEAASEETVKQYMQLRSSYEELLSKYKAIIDENKIEFTDLATLNEIFAIGYTFYANGTKFSSTYNTSWGHILRIVGPNLYNQRPSVSILLDIKSHIEGLGPGASIITINQMHADTIRLQLHVLDLLNIEAAEVEDEGMKEFIGLTQKGKAELIKLMVVRTEFPSMEKLSGRDYVKELANDEEIR